MKKLIYLIVIIVAFGLIVSGCIPVVPPSEQGVLGSRTNGSILYVDDDGILGVDCDYNTIQEAINAASNGFTIIVAAGTYTNDILDGSSYKITKSVTLLGAQAGVDPQGSTDRGDESILVRTNGLPYSLFVSGITIDGFMNGNTTANSGGRFIIAPGANNVTIKNCIIQNTPSTSSGHGVYIYPGAENALIEYNTFYKTAWEAIASWQVSGAVISHNHIDTCGIKGDIHAIQMMGHAGSNNVIAYNHISGMTNSNAIQYWGGPGATISHNVIDGGNTMYDGIWLDKDADGSTVSNNQIFDTIYAGINVREGCTNVLITYNDISGCGTGVDVVGIVTGTVINFNEIYENGMGVANYDSIVTVYAEYNWWGDVSGPYDSSDMDDLSQYNPGGLGNPVTEYVLYEPWTGQGGMVTGGGWIMSPAGAYTPDTNLSGKATFGFVSMYKKGAAVPTGKTQFNFQVADLNFHSDSYDWLVVAGAKAMYKGTGTINGTGDYGFMLSAIDADINESDIFDVDRFRIKIWDIGTDTVIYDNHQDDENGTKIGGGQIVIHKGK
jgi:hypothetical protein